MSIKNKKRPEPVDFMMGKIPPQAIDLEEIVLGSMMLEASCRNEVMQVLPIGSFYREQNQLIYEAIIQLHHKNEPVDILTVTEQLRENGTLDQVGGPFYITGLTERIGSTANVEYHARIILQKFIQREIIRIANDLTHEAYEDTTDVLELVEKFGKQYDELSTIAQSGAEMVHVSQAVVEVINELRNRETYAKQGRISGIPTPLKELNRILGGWMKTDLVIIAARPSMGKTAFMLQIAKTAALHGFKVAIFSMEMSKLSLTNRMILAESGVDDNRFRSGYVNQEDWGLIGTASNVLNRLQIYIDDRPGLSMHQIQAKATQMKRSGKCDIVLIDYLQLTSMKSANKQYNREQEVSESSRTAKNMAKSMDVPVILLSQLSREVEKRGDKIPMLSDLRESGSIEQDADIVIFPLRPFYYDGEAEAGVINFHIAKHRNGAVGVVSACHNETMTRIFDKPDDYIPENKSFSDKKDNPF